MFFNTLYLVFLALVISALWGIPAGIYLAEYARDGKLTNWVRMAVETLSSLRPSWWACSATWCSSS